MKNNVISISGVRADLEQVLHPVRRGVPESNAPTQHRIARAVEHGEAVVARGEGEMRQWRISPTLDDLRRRGTIDDLMHKAVVRFLQEYYLANYVGQRITPGYGERVSASAERGHSEEQRLHYYRETERALMAVAQPFFSTVLRWVLATLTGSAPLSCDEMIDAYAPGFGKQTGASRCGMVLAMFCLRLCEHYGIPHALNQPRYRDELSRVMDAIQGRFAAELEAYNRQLLGSRDST